MVGNIKKLRKYYLFQLYLAFLNSHDIVLFVNANADEVRLLMQKEKFNVNVTTCKNTLLKRKFKNYGAFTNLLTGELSLIGLKYANLNFDGCKELYKILNTSDVLVLGGLYLQANGSRVFFLPLDSTILEYHNNPHNVYTKLYGVTVVPVFYKNLVKLRHYAQQPYTFVQSHWVALQGRVAALSLWYTNENRQV